MKQKMIIFDFAGTLVRMRPPKLLISRQKLADLASVYSLGIVTGGSRTEVLNVLRKLAILSYFKESNIITKNDCIFRKPDPKLLRIALKDKDPKRGFYIGDTNKDSKMASLAGVNFILADNELARELDKLLLSGS